MILRLFVAAALPETTSQQIEAAVAPLRRELPAASWTRSESFHLTFAFLGDQNESVVDPLFNELAARLSTQSLFEIVAAQCGFFPSPRRPRVAWIALEPEEELKRVAGHVRDGLRARAIVFDEKDYRPHLTLARMRERWSADAIETFKRGLSGFATFPAKVDSVVIYKSQISPKGAIHTPLRRVLFQ